MSVTAAPSRGREHRLPRPPTRRAPDVGVGVDDAWFPAEIRSPSLGPSGWWATCSWHRTIWETRFGTFHEDDVRRDTVDRSYGRNAETRIAACYSVPTLAGDRLAERHAAECDKS